MKRTNQIRVGLSSLIHWIRAAVFLPKFAKKIEMKIIENRGRSLTMSPAGYIPIAKNILDHLFAKYGANFGSSVVFEIGTGRHLAVPLILRLFGVGRIVTADIEDILIRAQIVRMAESIAASEEILALARSYGLDITEKLDLFKRLDSIRDKFDLLCFLGVDFHPECDLSNSNAVERVIPTKTDVAFSSNVLEHIEPDTLELIFKNLVNINPGDFIQYHHVDLADHLSHAIKGLHPLNFYRYSPATWAILAGNRYMYSNRLTLNDYSSILESAGIDNKIDVLKRLDESEFHSAHTFCADDFSGKEINVIRISIEISN